MNPNDPDDPNEGPAPFPSAPPSPFPPLGQEMAPPAAMPEAGADEGDGWIEAADPHDLPTREPALIALGRFAFPPEPPLDDEGLAARDRRWAGRTVLVVAVFMLIFNGAAIQSWARQQEPGWITTTVQQLADVWTAQVAQLGADRPREAVRETYEAARDVRFPGQGGDSSPL